MKTSILRMIAAGLLASAFIAGPVAAQTNETGKAKPAAEKKEAKAGKKRNSTPFRGTVGAIDKNAMTLGVGERTLLITSETRISKAGKPATLGDGAVGEPVAGSYKTDESGILTATMVRFGPPEGDSKGEPKKEKKSKEQ